MNPSSCKQRKLDRHEHGAALGMAVLFLAVLSILGLAGVNAARQEILVAGNKRQQNTALGNTEYVSAAGEQDIMSLAVNPFSPNIASDHYYPAGSVDFNPATTGVMEQPVDRNWSFSHATVLLPNLNGITADGAGGYVIQDAGLITIKGEDVTVNGILRPVPGARLQAFRVTARSMQLRGAQRTIETVVLREPLPQQVLP